MRCIFLILLVKFLSFALHFIYFLKCCCTFDKMCRNRILFTFICQNPLKPMAWVPQPVPAGRPQSRVGFMVTLYIITPFKRGIGLPPPRNFVQLKKMDFFCSSRNLYFKAPGGPDHWKMLFLMVSFISNGGGQFRKKKNQKTCPKLDEIKWTKGGDHPLSSI